MKHILSALSLLILCYSIQLNAVPKTNDMLKFGDQKSELMHQLKLYRSDIILGGLNEKGRTLLADSVSNWEGGRVQFNMNVDPILQNYFTIKFWGNDISHNRLILFVEGKQIGYRHLGDIDVLDHGSDEPAYNNRFYYKTSPLPVSLTQGKKQLHCEIRSNGPLWGYGQSFEQYQKIMTEKSRGIYAVYTHTEGCFEPATDEKQGESLKNVPIRKEPGEEVVVQVKKIVNEEISKLLLSTSDLNQMQIQFLAKAYLVKWSLAYKNEELVNRLVKSIDAIYLRFLINPELAQKDPETPNPGWFGFGMVGQSIWLLGSSLDNLLNQSIALPDNKFILRKAAYIEMLKSARDLSRMHRNQYTNQAMIKDLYGIYYDNKGMSALKSSDTMPESEAVSYLYESIGINPWLGSDTPTGSAKPMGNQFYQLTSKGLTKELGYVGYYGEVLDWVTQIYEATRQTPNEPGDVKIKEQLIQIAKARAAFRYPMLDAEGNRSMRIETIIGWRDTYYPGNVVYGQRTSWDGTALETLVSTEDETLLGYAQQMLVDNQFFSLVRNQLKDRNFRTTVGLLHLPDQYEWVQEHQKSGLTRLPMSLDQPDFVFTDEEDGVLAMKNGNEILYASLYWRSRYGINDLARFHYITPNYDRIAVVKENTKFESSGMIYIRQNWTDFGFGNGGHTYPGKQSISAHLGEIQQIAKIPDGIMFRPGQENPYAGKADFYTCLYGKYIIGMNCSCTKTFNLTIPKGYKIARELPSRKVVSVKESIEVKPQSTVILEILKY